VTAGSCARDTRRKLDELRALSDQSRRVIAGLQLSYAEETGVRSLKIKHNNVLGYFIEVTALNAGPLTEGDEAKAEVYSPADHGQCHAVHHHRAVGSRNPHRKCGGRSAGDRACRL
jgi:hypothetical protein